MRLIDADAFDEWLQKHEEAAAALEAADSDVFVDKDRKTYYSTQAFRDVMRYRPTISRAKKVVHFHQEFPEHDWARDEDGKIDEFAMEYEYHNGPYCNRCGYSFCINCTPRGWDATRCIVDYNTCPTCGGRVVRSQHFCDKCGQELDWE